MMVAMMVAMFWAVVAVAVSRYRCQGALCSSIAYVWVKKFLSKGEADMKPVVRGRF